MISSRRALRVGLCFEVDVLLLPRYKNLIGEHDVLLFPELLDGGYAALKRGMRPHAINDGFISVLKHASKEFSNTILTGSTLLKERTSRPTNTSLVFSLGKLIHRYDKIHLFKPGGDTKFFAHGSQAGTFRLPTNTGPLRAGVVICYDLRFPELMRALASDGMDILFVPARWPAVRDEAWQTLLKARAIENQIFVVGCNSTDAEGGYSYAFDPLGRLISSNRRQKMQLLHTIDLDLHRTDEATRFHDNLKEAVFLKKHWGKS